MARNRAVAILPQMPITKAGSGKYFPIIYGDLLAQILGGNFHLCINELDSFSNRAPAVEPFINRIDKLGIQYADLWIDSDNVESLLGNVERLVEMGYISELETSYYRCKCGRVEIEESKILTCNPNKTDFVFKDGRIYSKCCGSICDRYEEKVLIFTPPKSVSCSDMFFLPRYLNSDSKTFERIILNSYVTISKKRNTGIVLNYNGTYYNLDIDFLWATYMANFDEKQKVVIAGNKLVYQLFLVGLLNKILKPEDETILLGTPIILNADSYLNETIDPEVLKLAVAFNTRPKYKETPFDPRVLEKLNSLDKGRVASMTEFVTTSTFEGYDLVAEIECALRQNFSMQRALRKLKEGAK